MLIFVYGTLMRGNENHIEYLSGCAFIGQAQLFDYALYGLGEYPGIVPQEGGDVKGEVFEIDETVKARIDELEEEGSLYSAHNVNVVSGDGKLHDALTYVYIKSIRKAVFIPAEKQPWRKPID